MTVEKENQFKDNLLLFVRIGTGILGTLFLVVIISRIIYPFSNGTWEAMNWMPAAHLLEGKNPYAFAFTPPYSMTPYGILHYALTAVGVWLFGFQMWFGRVLSVLGFAVCIISVFKITRKITVDKEAATAACLAGLAMFPAQLWVGIMRPDLVAAGFSFAALWLAFTLEEDKKTSFGHVAAMVFLSLAAFFTKQTFLLATGIIFLRFLQVKKWREAVWFVSAVVILAASLMFLLNYTSSGGYFWQHFTHARRLPFSLEHSARNLIEMLKHPSFFFSVVFLFVFIYHNRKFFSRASRNDLREILRSRELLIFLYFPLSTVWAFLSGGREGAIANYYIEHSFVLAIVCGLIYTNFRRNALPNPALAMIVLLTLGGMFQQMRVLRGEYFRRQVVGYYREMSETAGKFTPPGSRCISIFPELVVRNGCSFEFDDFEEYQGDWSPELRGIFEREVKAGSYAVIIWHNDRLGAQFPNYRFVPMSQKVPEGYYTPHLYVRETPPSE
ncbi:MAG: glycosyltransferase family 39 protein [Pyrinomonadaceae bacterium]